MERQGQEITILSGISDKDIFGCYPNGPRTASQHVGDLTTFGFSLGNFFKLPKFSLPPLALPKISLPKINLPKISIPKITTPNIGKAIQTNMNSFQKSVSNNLTNATRGIGKLAAAPFNAVGEIAKGAMDIISPIAQGLIGGNGQPVTEEQAGESGYGPGYAQVSDGSVAQGLGLSDSIMSDTDYVQGSQMDQYIDPESGQLYLRSPEDGKWYPASNYGAGLDIFFNVFTTAENGRSDTGNCNWRASRCGCWKYCIRINRECSGSSTGKTVGQYLSAGTS